MGKELRLRVRRFHTVEGLKPNQEFRMGPQGSEEDQDGS